MTITRLQLFIATGTFLAASFLTSGNAFCSVNGSVYGSVKDRAGAVVAGASVTVVNAETGVQDTVTTNSAGDYSFPTLPVGQYDIEFRNTGFKVFRQTGLTLDVNSRIRIDATLDVGNVTEQVDVTANALQVETSTTQLGEVIDSQRIEQVPLNGRSYTDLLSLQPGVAPVTAGTNSAVNNSPSGSLNPGNLSVNGGREDSNGFVLNGGTVQDTVINGTAIIPNLDSIAEFRILTANFDAEYGNFSGGQINVVTKSGTNQFHGNLFEFLRNTDLDARNYYSPNVGKFNQNQFGGTFGGPIKHDKIFFFGDYQGTRQVVGLSTGTVPVPSAADHSGQVSDLAGQLTGSVTGANWADLLSQELGYPVAVGEPYYASGCASAAQCVFPNATIPQAAFSSPAQPLMKYIPLPNDGPYYSTSAFNQTLNDNKFGIRADANTTWGLLSAYYFFDKYTLVNPYGQSSLPGFDVLDTGQAQVINLSDTKSIGTKAVNEFRFQFFRYPSVTDGAQGGLGPSPSSQGFVQGPGTLGIVPVIPSLQGVVPIGFNNYSIGVGGPTNNYLNTYQWLDNFSRVVGNHSLKFGGAFNWLQDYRYINSFSTGSFAFNGTETGSDWVDFLIGAPSYFAQGQFESSHFRQRYLGVYAQDSWRVIPNLTLNYGLRWDVIMPSYEVFSRINSLVAGEQSKVFPTAPVGIVFPGDPGIPSTIVPTRYNDFAPRIGLAYAPSASGGPLAKLLGPAGNTSIRASFGVFFSSYQNYTTLYLVGDAPYGYYYSSPTYPLFATPYVDRQTGHVEGQRFPVVFPPPNTSPKNPDTSIDWAQFEPIDSPGFSPANRVPYVEEYSLSLQRGIGARTVLSLNYVGTQGHKLLGNVESNPGNPALCLSVSQANQVASGSPICGPFGENNVYTTTTGQVINGTRAPLGIEFGANALSVTQADSNFNSAQVTLHHSAGALQFLLGYTYSRSFDNASASSGGSGGGQLIVTNPKLGYGLSAFDVTHNFVASYVWELPFARLGHANQLTSGWRLSGITRFATGFPVTMNENDDLSLLGTCNNGPGGCDDLPNYTRGPLNISNPRKQNLSAGTNPYFNTSLFSPENLGQLGNSNRRFFHGPGINNFDMALLKNLRVREGMEFQGRAEFFNVFNHAQFNLPSGNINSSTFGFVTSANPARIGQISLKFIF
jgi:Carboxypeptidase regulatory-like domain/TonB dependent receptor